MSQPLLHHLRGEPMTEPHDCLACCVAYLLDVPRSELPSMDVANDWEASWKRLSDWMLERGWYFGFTPDDPRPTLYDFTKNWGPIRYLWIASVSHESWPDEWAHALVMHGARVAFDPAKDTRPPKTELLLNGRFFLTPLDASEFSRSVRRNGAA